MPAPLYLDEAQIRSCIHWPDLFSVLKRALIAFSAGSVVQPLRSVTDLARGTLFLMPACLDDPPALGAKLVTIFEHNAARNVPTHQATLAMLDPQTGELIALLEGGFITAARTAAVSALSVEALARSDSSTLAIIGSGVQARSHAEVLPLIHPFRQIRAWSPTAEHLAQFAASSGVTAADSAEAAVRDADVVVLATTSSAPVIDDAWVKAGAHVISVGAPRPHLREADPALLRRSRVYVDSLAAAKVEAGDLIHCGDCRIHGELGALLAGTIAGRQGADEVTFFKSLGLAVEDVATGAQVLHKWLHLKVHTG